MERGRIAIGRVEARKGVPEIKDNLRTTCLKKIRAACVSLADSGLNVDALSKIPGGVFEIHGSKPRTTGNVIMGQLLEGIFLHLKKKDAI